MQLPVLPDDLQVFVDEVVPLLIRAGPRPPSYPPGTLRERRRTYTDLVKEIIERGVHQGQFRTPDASLVTLQIFGMCNYAWTWYRPDGDKSSEQIAREFTRTILTGLQSPNGASDVTAFDQLVDTAIATVRAAPGRLPPETD